MSFAVSWRSYRFANVVYARYRLTHQQDIDFKSNLIKVESKNGQDVQPSIHHLGELTPLFYQKFLVWQAHLPVMRTRGTEPAEFLDPIYSESTTDPEEKI